MFDSDSTRRSYLKTVGTAGALGMSGLAGCTAFGGGGSGGDETITVAAAVPETGRLSSVGNEMLRGYEMGVSVINENGGIDGKEVELIVQDDESDPATLRQVLQQTLSNNDVDMVWGSFSSPLVMAGSALAENEGLPFLAVATCYQAPLTDEGKEWTYTPFPKTRDVTRATTGLLDLIPESERPQTVGIWEENSGWGKEMAEAWDTKLSEAGYDVAMRETYGAGNQDFSTLISQSESAGVEALVACPQPPDGITAMTQLNNSGYTPDFIEFVRAADPQAWWSALGESGNYVTMCPGWAPGMTGNGNQTLLDTYRASTEGAGENAVPRVMVGVGYNLTQTAEQALSGASSTDPADVKSSLDENDFQTVIGEFSFDQYGMPEPGQLSAASAQWWNGEQQLVYPQTENAADLQFPIE
ncbi:MULTISPECIES: amino acid ABC transporter substrate-binding protein [Halobacterium]|uniref:amino acid ABC transporter substrate-binding protein n=1 Tax=Halobacterium TaxID=2239 RepID=UPI0018D264D4|nr:MULTISPECIES: amino acid ABC transporter substrate-binding protein [Halobacterium]MCG1003240.1 amino acid ABC transporter substrate-binding protein [Halobacterium noricense]